MKYLVFVFFVVACTSELSVQEDAVEEVEVVDAPGEAAPDVTDGAGDVPLEAPDGPQEPDEVPEVDIAEEDVNGQEEATEDVEEVSEDDVLEELELGEALEVYAEDVEEESDDLFEEEAESCGGCPEGWQCCRGECVELGTVENCGGCGDFCLDLDGDGCQSPICEGICGMVDDDSNCGHELRCFASLCRPICSEDMDCEIEGQCVIGEFCHDAGVCLFGVHRDCADEEDETVDDCHDWEMEGYEGYRETPCCHICDSLSFSCPLVSPWPAIYYCTDPGSLDGVFEVSDPGEVGGPCSITHVVFYHSDNKIWALLIDEQRGVLADRIRMRSFDVRDGWFFGAKEISADPAVSLRLEGYFSLENENKILSVQTRAAAASGTIWTLAPGCAFLRNHVIEMGMACKVCHPGADEIPAVTECRL